MSTISSYWDKFSRPPKSALKTIGGGRLKGMTDVNPQWRYKAMTDIFGPCGVGWRYEIVRVWTEEAASERLAFAEIMMYIRHDGEWSSGVPGIGGSKMAAAEKSGLVASDECYKMAITDALSVTMKMLGVAADIYAGLWDGSKYIDGNNPPDDSTITAAQLKTLEDALRDVGIEKDNKALLSWLKIDSIENLPAKYFQATLDAIAKRKKDD